MLARRGADGHIRATISWTPYLNRRDRRHQMAMADHSRCEGVSCMAGHAPLCVNRTSAMLNLSPREGQIRTTPYRKRCKANTARQKASNRTNYMSTNTRQCKHKTNHTPYGTGQAIMQQTGLHQLPWTHKAQARQLRNTAEIVASPGQLQGRSDLTGLHRQPSGLLVQKSYRT